MVFPRDWALFTACHCSGPPVCAYWFSRCVLKGCTGAAVNHVHSDSCHRAVVDSDSCHLTAPTHPVHLIKLRSSVWFSQDLKNKGQKLMVATKQDGFSRKSKHTFLLLQKKRQKAPLEVLCFFQQHFAGQCAAIG